MGQTNTQRDWISSFLKEISFVTLEPCSFILLYRHTKGSALFFLAQLVLPPLHILVSSCWSIKHFDRLTLFILYTISVAGPSVLFYGTNNHTNGPTIFKHIFCWRA